MGKAFMKGSILDVQLFKCHQFNSGQLQFAYFLPTTCFYELWRRAN